MACITDLPHELLSKIFKKVVNGDVNKLVIIAKTTPAFHMGCEIPASFLP